MRLRFAALPSELRLLSRSFSTTSLLLRNPPIFFHPHSPTSLAMSFLPSPSPSHHFSPTTIGTLTLPISDSAPPDPSKVEVTPRAFQENPDFTECLHEILRGVVGEDEWLKTEAVNRVEGYIHIADMRNPADTNRVPDPSDIIASVLVQDGKVVPESYEPSPTYRLVTTDGLLNLEEGLAKRVLEGLKKVRSLEEEFARENQ